MLLTLAPAMLEPPAGWQPHEVWGNLALDVGAHRSSFTLAIAMAALLILGRALLAAEDRKRLRIAFACFIMLFAALPLRAVCLSRDDVGHYGTLVLASNVLLAWGAIGVGGLLVFDLMGKRAGVPKILRDLTITIASVAALVVLLSRSGVNLLSIITTSAVLTAVIGLALQNTLSDLMSGIALQLDSSFAIGDWIRVDKDGQVGVVREIRWRSTVIETRNGDLITIPNGILTKSTIQNFAKDGRENRRWVYFNVHMRHPPNQVIDTVHAALKGIPNVSDKTPPDCVLMDFGDSWGRYAVRYRLVDFRPDDPTDSAVRTRVWYALHRASIELSYPAHNVFVTQLDAQRDQRKLDREHQRRLDAVARVHFFTPLEPKERETLAQGLRHEVYGPGEVIIRAGADGDSLYLICSGDVSVKIGVDGLEREVAILRPGDFFGEMSLMTGEPRRATVVAKHDAECYVVTKAMFEAIVRQNPKLLGEIGHLLHDRQTELEGKRDGLSAEANAARATAQNALMGRIKSFFGLGA
jgi:small-conductance mechanosensitive channel/CRP-like cAMP-binding protein